MLRPVRLNAFTPNGRREVAKPAKQFRPVRVSVVFSRGPAKVQMDVDVDGTKTGASPSMRSMGSRIALWFQMSLCYPIQRRRKGYVR